ncbi:AT-rich interactive domain-containing protein 4B isoform X2 [Stegostoma tigrinum]|uniref:AT-rich interactive domain-containing protein 4B isoform X2 n=1 Tax=Stegostoma tigrinum TaxID=3053191 RepID=UPI002870AE8E|nr:AT-rich interactive domain-containing protein 4B isoform X2 [Stegostoma tigrinum]
MPPSRDRRMPIMYMCPLVTFKHDSSTVEVQDDHIKGPLKVGAVVEVKNPDGTYQVGVINKLTDASWYTVVFDDGDERTLRRTSLCLKGERHFAESETLDQLPLTNPEHFGTPVIGKKSNRGRRSNPLYKPESSSSKCDHPVLLKSPEEEESSSSSDEDDEERRLNDELIGKIVCVECANGDKRKTSRYPALVISPDCSDEVTVKKDSVLVRSFKDGKLVAVPRKDIAEFNTEMASKYDAAMKEALDQALEFLKSGAIPNNWKTELKDESSSSDEEGHDEEESSEEEEEVEPFPEERENFLQQLYKFMEDRGTPINKRPVLGYRDLNLFKLYRLVHELGGFDSIESGAVWKQVYQDLGIPVMNSAAGYNVKCAYRKYLCGFEDYCKSANIQFPTSLQGNVKKEKEKKECDKDHDTLDHTEEKEKIQNIKPGAVEVENENEGECKDIRDDDELKDQETKSQKTRKKYLPEIPAQTPDSRKDSNKVKTEECEESKGNQINNVKDISRCKTEELKTEKLEDKGKHGDESSKEDEEDEEDEENEEEDDDEEEREEEEEEFECYPAGMKVQVRYGRGRNQKLYEASIKDYDVEGGIVLYLVHYCGWNVRYDEWIKADKIVRPADKNVPKIKHRKKIKGKVDKEKESSDKKDKEDKSPSKSARVHRVSKSPAHPVSSDVSPILIGVGTRGCEQDNSTEGHSILNGVQGCSEESDDDDGTQCEATWRKDPQHDSTMQERKEQAFQDQRNLPTAGMPTAGAKLGSISDPLEWVRRGKCSEDEEEETVRLKLTGQKEPTERWAKSHMKRSRRKRVGAEDWTQKGSPNCKSERSKGKESPLNITTSSSSSSDEDSERIEMKSSPTRKHNGLQEKRKPLHTTLFTSFSEMPEKRIKLLNNSELRVQNAKVKDRKDVWSSIQIQWPKKVLKELFSDSDTETTSSPPVAPEEAKAEGPTKTAKEEERLPAVEVETAPSLISPVRPNEEKPAEKLDKKGEMPSSGSNSVLNTPPTTPESPVSVTVTEATRPQPNTVLTQTLAPSQEEVQSVKSETDSTNEVDSVTGELQEGQSEGNVSPTGFDASISSSSSNQPEPEHKEKIVTGHKRQKDTQGGSSTKKQKRSHKRSGINNKKKSRTANSSDSEEMSASENTAKLVQVKKGSSMVPTGMNSLPGSTSTVNALTPGKSPRNGEKESSQEHSSRSSRTYKWSVQMADVENMSSVERIAFLQEKLQEIRRHYLSLKSEVASIDRRRKRMKKKDRDTNASATTASSSSSPSSSSITAAVMLTLADPSVSNSSQNGLSVECR